LEKDMFIRRYVAVAGLMLALLLSGQAFAQQAAIFDQVPGDALVVLRIKNLEAVNKKVAKIAKELGLDQMAPEMADPLGALEEQAKIGKGVNRAGDLAFVFVDPQKVGGNPDKAILILVPVSDYKAFAGQMKDAKADGEVTEAKTPQGETLFIAHRGDFAAIAQNKDLVSAKATGVKLTGVAAKEADAKDAILWANISQLKGMGLPKLKDARKQAMEGIDRDVGREEAGKKFVPVIKALVNSVMDLSESFLNDATSASVGLGISDAGLTATVVADFTSGSYLGKFAAGLKNTDAPLTAGLPDKKYFAFGGMVQDPAHASKYLSDLIDPIAKELATIPEAKSVTTIVDNIKKSSGATNSSAFGYAAPNGALGQESVIQAVVVMNGESKTIHDAQKNSMEAMGDLFKMLPQGKGAPQVKYSYKAGAKNVDGASLDEYKTDMILNDDDPQAAQAKQILAWVYGPNGQSGVMGAVSPKTFLMVQGGSDDLVASVASAKAGTDTLSNNAGVKMVAGQLPKQRAVAMFVKLDTIVSTGVRFAKGLGLPVNVKMPQDLPPIGMTMGSEGSALRADGFIPLDLVKGLVAAGLEAQKNLNNPNGGL